MKLLKFFLIILLLNKVFSYSSLFFDAVEDVAQHMAATNHEIAAINSDAEEKLFEKVVKVLMTRLPVKVRNTLYVDRDWIIYRKKLSPFREDLSFMVMDTLSLLRGSMKPAKHFFNRTDGSNLVLKESAVIVANSLLLLESINDKLQLLNQYPTHIQIVIVCPDVTFKEIETLLDSKFQHKVYFLIEEENSVKLLTFEWFTRNKCDGKELVVVNEYKESTGWKNENFEIRKFFNFHGCQIGIGVIRDFPATFFMALRDKFKNPIPPSEIQYAGYYVTLIKDMSSNLNYKYAFNPSLSDILVELSDHFSRYHIKDVKVDLRIVSCPNSVYLTQTFLLHVTNAHAFAENFLLIPPGELYTDLEKFLLPFDMETWIGTIAVFFVAFVAIFVVHCCKKSVRDEVYGIGVRNPCLNLFAHFCGLGQNVLPFNNFPRILLMTFILFSLIIRNAYQSKIFEFLQKDLRKPEVKTIDELVEKNFTFYVHEEHFELLSNLEIFQR